MADFLYFDTKHAILVHDKIIEQSGGSKGVSNVGLIDSTIFHIKNDVYYPTIEEKSHIYFTL